MSRETTAPVSDEHDESSSAGGEDEEAEEEVVVESLVLGRSKRVTAGNRMSSLLQQEGDDELELLFAEDGEEEDVEFDGGEDEDPSDVQLDTSSDEDDQSPAANDDLEGEKELQKQDRAERRKKRKAQDIFPRPGPLRKKVKVDSTAIEAYPTTPAPRPRKKSERLNWLPSAEEGPTRSSSRKQTMENKTIIHERMKESERRRLKQIRVMEAAAKRKEVSRPKAMTQADRMAEAARMEKKNAKSLNRWEEAEKKRAEEQRAKLEALHNRQLSGPVITWWSGLARWVNGKLGQVGIRAIRAIEDAEGGPKAEEGKDIGPDKTLQDRSNVGLDQDTVMVEVPQPLPPAPTRQQPDHAGNSEQTEFAPPQGPYGFLDGIHYYAALPTPAQQTREPPEPVSPRPHAQDVPPSQHDTNRSVSVVEYSTRNLVNLENIDANAMKIPELQNHILLKKRNAKPPKPVHEPCAITNQPARFRDPKTGLPYADSYAYKEIQRLRDGGSRWSGLLGCYVGPVGNAARGVPERFLKRT